MRFLPARHGAFHKTQIDLTYNSNRMEGSRLTHDQIRYIFETNGTSDSRKDWFAVGEYKKLPNEVCGRDTVLPEEVSDKMKTLLTEYNAKEAKTFEDNLKMFYYRGLKEWDNEKSYLKDTCLTAQDKYKAYMDYFRIAY